MAEFIDRAVNGAPNIAKLRNTLDSKIDSIQEEAKQGYEILSSIFLGDIYEEMLVAIAAPDVTTAQKWLLAVSFVIKVERLRVDNGGKVADDASHFFDGVISKVLDSLETTPPLIASDMWHLLMEAFDFILIPSVAAVVRCHRRLANRAFKFIMQTPNNEDTEKVLLTIVTWMCSTRTFDVEKADDSVYVNQLRLLQNSANERISKEALYLILNNLAKLCKKDKRAVSALIGSNVKHVVKELELGTTITKLARVLELLTVTFERCKMGDSEAIMDLVPLWKMFEMLFERLNESDMETATRVLKLLPTVATCLGPDLVLINIQHLGKIMDILFQHKVDVLVGHVKGIETLLKEMNDLCPDFYLLFTKQCQELVGVLKSSVESAKWDVSSKVMIIITQMSGPSVGPIIEGLILNLISNDKVDWNDTELANSAVQLVHRYLKRGCSKHPKVLKLISAFLRQLRGLRGHDRFMDNSINEVSRMICNPSGSDSNTDYTLYAEELQKYTERFSENREHEAKTENTVMQEVKPALETAKAKQDDVVDAIRKKLKSMRQASAT